MATGVSAKELLFTKRNSEVHNPLKMSSHDLHKADSIYLEKNSKIKKKQKHASMNDLEELQDLNHSITDIGISQDAKVNSVKFEKEFEVIT